MYQTVIGSNIQTAADFLRQGELVAIPTETVYGLAANACDDAAIKKVYSVKQRPAYNPLIVHLHSFEKLCLYTTEVPRTAQLLMEAFSPGPITLILPTNGRLSSFVNNGQRLVAFRVPAHPIAMELLKGLSFPLAAPSANLFTSISPTQPNHVLKNFKGKIPYILDGGSCQVGIESTVVGFQNNGQPIVYRQGGITIEEIELVVGAPVLQNAQATSLSPGLTKHHYSPRTPLYLLEECEAVPLEFLNQRTGVLCYSRYKSCIPVKNQFILSPDRKLNIAARNLYKGLHHLDELGLDCLIAEKLPNIELGKAINDRLLRAAHPQQYVSSKTSSVL